MTRINEVLVYSVIFLFSMIVLGSCNSLDDMMDKYDEEYLRTISKGIEPDPNPDSQEEDPYEPGLYKLPALITEPSYNVFVGQKSSYQIKVRGAGLRNYSYWLKNPGGDLLGSSTLEEDGQRYDEGSLVATGATCYILPSATKYITSEDPDNLNYQMAFTFICHAFNAYGDEYWDEAWVHVIPVQALEWYTTDGTLDAEGTNSNMLTITDCKAVQLENEVSFNDIADLKVWTDMGVKLTSTSKMTFTSYTPGTLTIIVWNHNVKDAVQPTVTGTVHSATLRKYTNKNATGMTTYTISFEGADTWTISNDTGLDINPIVYVKAQMSMTGAVE
jgi:hypothetical protein